MIISGTHDTICASRFSRRQISAHGSAFPGQSRCRSRSHVRARDRRNGRYYDPATGQFLNVDPLVDETGQAYAYTGDDPVNATDPLGFHVCNGNPLTWGGCVGNAAQGVAGGAGSDYGTLVQADQWAGKQIAAAICNNGGNNGILASELGCGPSTAQCLAAIAGTYEQDLAQAKANYARDVAANNEALDTGQISSEEWVTNQLNIMNEFRQAEQYFKRIYESESQTVTDESIDGGLGDGE